MPKVTWIKPKRLDPVKQSVLESLARNEMDFKTLAKHVGVTPSAISQSMAKPERMTVERLRQIAKATNSNLVIRLEAKA